MDKTDLMRELKGLYTASDKKAKMLDVPPMSYLAVDGVGAPDKSKEFKPAMEALFNAAYTIKFTLKSKGKDFKVMPPEGTWEENCCNKAPETWKWTLMMALPDFVKDSDLKAAVKSIKGKKSLPAIDKLRLEKSKKGKAVQIMQVGPYKKVGETVKVLGAFAKEKGYALTGRLREIYFSDPRRVPESKIKTLIRHPVKKA